MILTNIQSDWMSNASSDLCIYIIRIIFVVYVCSLPKPDPSIALRQTSMFAGVHVHVLAIPNRKYLIYDHHRAVKQLIKLSQHKILGVDNEEPQLVVQGCGCEGWRCRVVGVKAAGAGLWV